MYLSDFRDSSFSDKLDDLLFNTTGARHYEKHFDENKDCDYEKCKECGGKCCKRCGCFFSPDDFEDLSFDGIKKEMDKGHITVEVVDGDQFYIEGFIYTLRARNVEDSIFIGLSDKKRSPCILLTEKGCKLDYEHRPTGGKLLIPGKTGNDVDCISKYDVPTALREWRAHQKLLHELASYYKRRDIPCTI